MKNYIINQGILKQEHIYYSFIFLALIISSIFVDVIFEFSLSTIVGTQFYSIDHQANITYLIVSHHYTIICILINIVLIFYFSWITPLFITICSCHYQLSIHSRFEIPIYQDMFVLISSYFIKGPINMFEVLASLNYCYNIYHINHFNIIFIIYILLIILLVAFIL